MDFGSLLNVAQKNEKMPKREFQYYSTKFEPPKKEERSKQLSSNIKKFLARKEEEEKRKAHEAKLKREELLALRSQDKKATRRVSVMLKRTKSANKSVIQDAVDNVNTAVTLAGPSQPDEDDYGYVSQEASLFYNKMMAKYNNTPDDSKSGLKKNSNTNLLGTKDRVRAALLKEQEDALLPHKRKRKPKEHENNSNDDYNSPDHNEPSVEREKKEKPKHRPAAPPPLNFSELLKIAEKKQFEPIKIEPKKEVKEDERPMTKKQKREFEKERAWRERKEKGLPNPNTNNNPTKPVDKMLPPPNKIPKLTSSNGKIPKIPSKPDDKSRSIKPPQTIPKKPDDRPRNLDNRPINKKIEERTRPDISKLRVELEKNQVAARSQPPSQLNNQKPNRPKQLMPDRSSQNLNNKKEVTLKSKALQQKNGRAKQPPPSDLKPKQFPPADLKPKQFPPQDVRRFPSKTVKRKPQVGPKRRILDDDSEYDSEMDDFIDDGPGESEDYSKYISEIFGYDKSRYRDDGETDNMEASFSQVMREEFVSSKIGLMEDLEDMKKEAEDKKRKAMMKKMKK